MCIAVTYADAQDMYMLIICRCLAYGYVKDMLFSLFFTADPFSGRTGSSFNTTMRNNPMTQDVAAQSAANDTRYCVMHLLCDPVLRGRKDRFAYSLAVLHFRKVVIWKKVGSGRKDGAVI
ncbi:hypothetical protein BXJ38_22070 [Salmonella enterica subsp. enterica serovar Enteritidis]|nr:hypothetical protein [Salmonella enterica subsp. enterica serovar Enteritidis]EDF0770566.1 hypothetical protein [Salmonella enterica subsp. enterica serovar Enteritidis]